MKEFDYLFYILGFLIFLAFILKEQFSFRKRKKEFLRKRSREEKVKLFLNQIEPRVMRDWGGREIKNEEDCYYSSLLLDYQMAILLGAKASDPNLSSEELFKNQEEIERLKSEALRIKVHVKRELHLDIEDIAFP